KGGIYFLADPSSGPPANYDDVDAIDNSEIMEQTDFGYQLMGFKMNHRTASDVESGTLNPDNWEPNEDMNKKLVRQAMAYAVDRKQIVEKLLLGHGTVINAPIAQQFWAYDEDVVEEYEYD